MQGFLLLPLVVVAVNCDTLYFHPKENPAVPGVQCQDGKSFCPDGSTCCVQESGEYGCCPLANKVSLKLESVVCPDGQHECKDGQTCCKLSSGQWGCCPIPKAVCCSDGRHCCPSGTTCEVSSGKCKRGSSVVTDWIEKQPALLRSENVVCPDGQHECKSGQTCCKLSSGQWGCCPIPNAVCCSDGKHCCPSGTTCDVSSGKCQRGSSLVTDWFEKEPALLRSESVKCPDGQHECKTGQTCCKLSSGQWGCCPLPKAVCCSDGKHCCPEATTCDTGTGKCKRGNQLIMDWMEKQPALRRSENVVCPDGQHECKDGQTCCKLSSGGYGCCPLPKAVCCSDGKHCCPSGTTCEVSSGKCKRGSSLLTDWFEKQPALLRSENVVCPDGQHECKTDQTCCKLSSGSYGCCPVPNAVCCSDGKHCCAEGTTCEVSSGKCKRGSSLVMDWFEKQPALLRFENVVCPDGQHECRTGQTCCKLSSGSYGCCPIPNAVCCSDGKHCCPQNTQCQVSSGKCIRGDSLELHWIEKVPAARYPQGETSSVMCPDGASECKDGQTCCLLASGKYGCCPIQDAVCCSDHIHCCPQGTTCDLQEKKCIGQGESLGIISMDMVHIKEGKSQESHHLIPLTANKECPDGQSECKTGQTCCKLASGKYGCCPLPKAVCCADMKHCCPEGSTCEVSSGKCKRGDNILMDWFQKLPAVVKAESVICPDGQHECKDGQTCCKTASGQWGCCPVPNAVCCSDGKHCCPSGTQCEVSSGKCKRGSSLVTDWFEKQPALLRSENVVCPDGQHECKDGQTCCKLSSGQWGCCPIPNAVCCSDGRHCCPSGTTCDVSSGKCQRGSSLVMDWFEKQPALLRSENVVCPDGQHECKDGQTCCKLSSGQWGCCPIPNAVCCSDGKHCCPSGTTCEVSSGKCQRGSNLVMDWFEKQPALLRSENVVCPDGQHECKDGQTCCKLSSGQWGCCPIPNAVCCSDGKHCCPSGTQCEVSSGKCKRGSSLVTDWFEKQPALLRSENVVCPDGQHECKDGQTCCKLSSGQWGCCPIPKAVCCSDGKHCCPSGTQCEVSSGKCKRGSSLVMDWFEKQTALLRSENVVCPDGQHECKDRQTCCKTASGQWGCCPLPKAVCCSDGKHCCPSGTTCEVSSGKCQRGSSLVMDWFEKQPAHKRPHIETKNTKKENSVVCPDQTTSCPDKNTCCKNKEGKFGCCAYNHAVCCKSGTYCCPKGYICDTLPEICRMPEAKEAWRNTANIFIQNIIKKRIDLP
ncbi:multiple epidermal growth factor-like domains protein 6 isoform X4 [Saccostrea echinata]|uniref:multiple epidermal growth factor-like domains protein 6 isoform X4 n=1 Tax=Saccostrea echinata TaxID=191078 RepID=UPI002A83DF25|nr:multiple epidermal growth factor-like domains protein 6 isoform X4 [Saccostrea echinata]